MIIIIKKVLFQLLSYCYYYVYMVSIKVSILNTAFLSLINDHLSHQTIQ